MEHNHSDHDCIHCGCHSPILKMFGEDFITSNLPPMLADKIVHNGKQKGIIHFWNGNIRPLITGSEEVVCQSMLVKGDKVLFTGSADEINEYILKESITVNAKDKIDLGGRTMLPGFVESHAHLVPSAIFGDWVDLGGIDPETQSFNEGSYNPETVIAKIKTAAAVENKFDKDNWFLGSGLDPALMPFVYEGSKLKLQDITFKTFKDFDFPILIMAASLHTVYVNEVALELIYKNENLKLNDKYPNFEDFKSKTNGKLQESTQQLWGLKTIPIKQKIEMVIALPKNINRVLNTATERGFTFLYDAGVDISQNIILRLILPFLPRNVRLGAAHACLSMKDVNKLENNNGLKNTGYKEDESLYFASVKLVSDGSNQGLTGCQSQRYNSETLTPYGIFNFGTPEFLQMIYTIISKGWPLMIHANGDTAVKLTIENFTYAIDSIINDINLGKELIFNDRPEDKITIEHLRNLRHRIEHCSFISSIAQFDTMKTYGISPSFTIGHMAYWGNAFKNMIFGEEKANKLILAKSALNKGLKISLHSDYTVSPLGPLRMMEQSITRIMEKTPNNAENVVRETEDKIVLNGEQRISPMEALKAVTIDAAWSCNVDQWVGSLEPGKFADFVILEKDPLNMPDGKIYMNMRNIPVLETWKGGKRIDPNPSKKKESSINDVVKILAM
jgi:predicted amidohydrolase YtcJ